MSDLRKLVRVEQTLGDIERLQNEFGVWKERRNARDEKKQYQTQLQALHQVVTRSLADIHEDTKTILADSLETGAVYQRCRLQDKRILWVRRVLWGYYRDKFDQRDQSDSLKKLLEAADDVVWSCYRGAIQKAAPGQPLKPIPLAYIEPFYSPQAIPRDEPPFELRENRLGSSFLTDFFARLPIPLVSLTPNCLTAPWWMVYLGHEVGHHIQHDLGLVEPFQDLLSEIVTSGEEPRETAHAAQRWANWGQEIFSDVYSVYVMGGSAVWGMAELETQPDRNMIVRKESYPSPAARLGLLAAVADGLGLDGIAALRDQNPYGLLDQAPADAYHAAMLGELAADLGMLDKLVAGLRSRDIGDSVAIQTLADWNGSDFLPAGEKEKWQEALLKGTQRQAQRRLASARIIVSAGVEAWRAITTAEQVKDRARALEVLAGRVVEAIEQHRDKTTRAADPQAIQDVDEIAAELSAQLRGAEFGDEW